MRKIVIFFFLLIGANSVEAQTIYLGQIPKLAYCIGDSIVIPYQAFGTFASDNYFFVELSNANGSFSAFTSFGNDTSSAGSIGFKLAATGSDFQVRVASSDPYTLSDTNSTGIQVIPLPSPYASITPEWAFVGDTIRFTDDGSEPTGSQYDWIFSDSDASIRASESPTTYVTYSHEGSKSGSLTVRSPSGCTKSAGFSIYQIISCNPTIPRNVRVVTTTLSGENLEDTPVWVKPGGTFTAMEEYGGTAFVEPGGSVTICGNPSDWATIFYVRSGASVQGGTQDGLHSVEVTDSVMKGIATYNLYCQDLTFDYSQIQPASVAEIPAPTLSLIQSGDHLFANSEETPAEIRILNILGAEVLSQHGTGVLDIDLSPLPTGVYFAQVQSGDAREVRKIAVVH